MSETYSDIITLIVVGLVIFFMVTARQPLALIEEWKSETLSPPICVPAVDKDC